MYAYFLVMNSKRCIKFVVVVLTFEDLITFVTNYYVCGLSRVSLNSFPSQFSNDRKKFPFTLH